MKKLNEKNAIKELDKKNICYSIGVSINSFKGKALEMNNKEYFLMILDKDKALIKENKKFYGSKDYEQILMKDLNEVELDYFKKNSEKYTKVQHDKDGRIYELKNNSFRRYYNILK